MARSTARTAPGAVAVATLVAALWSSAFVPAARAEPVLPAGAHVDAARRSVVTVLGLRSPASLLPASGSPPRARRSLASGIVYDSQGRVATVASAVRDCDAILVRTADGRELKATLVGLDDDSDIALLQLPVTDLPALTFAPPGVDPTGQRVIAIAARSGGQPPVTQGSVRRRYEEPLGSLLLLSNEVYPGFSGGPVIDEKGQLIGLVVGRLEEAPADWADAPAAGGASSFALAGDDLKTILSHLEQYGRVRRGFLGVRMVQGEVVDANRPDDPFRIGVRVEEVLPESPAAQLDLRPGDLIVGWNGETLQSPEDLMRRVEGSPPGTIVPLVWVRNEERREGRLIVGAKPDDALLATPRERAPAIPPDSARAPKSGG